MWTTTKNKKSKQNDFEKNNSEIIELGPNGNNEVLQETSNRTIKQRLKTVHNEEITGGN